MLAVLLPIYIATALNARAYSIGCLIRARVGAMNALAAFLLTISAVAMVVFFLKVSTDFSRVVFGTGVVIAFFGIPLARFTLSSFARKLFGRSTLNEVIIVDGKHVRPAAGSVVLDAQRHGLAPRLDDPAMLERLGQCLRNADRVIVSCLPERRKRSNTRS